MAPTIGQNASNQLGGPGRNIENALLISGPATQDRRGQDILDTAGDLQEARQVVALLQPVLPPVSTRSLDGQELIDGRVGATA